MKTMNASEFKAKCLAILDDVHDTGEIVTILKRGKPVAQLVPPVPRDNTFPQHTLLGTVVFHGDVVEPVLESSVWDAEIESE